MLSRHVVFDPFAYNLDLKETRARKRLKNLKIHVYQSFKNSRFQTPNRSPQKSLICPFSNIHKIHGFFKTTANHVVFNKPREIAKNHDFYRSSKSRSGRPRPPKIIKNRLNFALSEQRTVQENPNFSRKFVKNRDFSIDLQNSKKIAIFLNI